MVQSFKLIVALALWSLDGAPLFAFPTQDDQTVGSMAIDFRRQSHVWSRLDVGFVDAQIKSSPPDSIKYDRRLESLAIVGGEGAIAGRWGLRVNAKAEYSRHKEAEQSAPRAVVEKTVITYTPSLDATFVTDKGLEIIAGLACQQSQAYSETVVSSSASSATHFDKSLLVERRAGVVRRAGPWTGGFYYSFGAQGERGFKQTASDQSSWRSAEQVFIPARMSVFGQFEALSVTWDTQLDFVQARGLGPKDARGISVYTDYFEARLGAYRAISGGFGLKLAGAYKTLSYANNAFVSLETMPVSSARALLVLGGLGAQAYFGVIGAYGKDGQSLPELNAQYKMTAFSTTAGFIFPL